MWGSRSKDRQVTDTGFDAAAPVSRSDQTMSSVSLPGSGRAAATTIASGATIQGSLTATGDVVVDGVVNGDVRSGSVTVGRDGEVNGAIRAETATIRGKVTGDVQARTIQLAGTGSIEGDLTHAVLVIEEGGVFEGRSRRLADPLAETGPAAQIPAPAAEAAAPASDDAPRSALADALGDAFAKP